MRNVGLGRYGAAVLLALTLVVAAGVSAQGNPTQELEQLVKQLDELSSRGEYDKAVVLAERLLEVTEEEFGPEDPATARAARILARVYSATGAYTKAERLLQRAVAITEKALGVEHPDTAQTLDELAVLYYTTGVYAKAEPLFRRVLVIREKTFGPEHRDTAQALDNLANVYYATGSYAEAETLFKRALVIREKTFGPEHRDTVRSLNNLARVYFATGAYAVAEPLLRRALAIAEKTVGPEHADTAQVLKDLALVRYATGDYSNAELLLQRALAITEKALGFEHPGTAQVLNNLARVHYATGDYFKAELLFQRALVIDEKILGPEHADTAQVLSNLARVYYATGAYAKAESLLLRALAITEKALGPKHPDNAQVLNNLAELYRAMGAYAKAEPLFLRALAITEKALGPKHPDNVQILINLAELSGAKGAYSVAEPLFRRALAISEETLGPEHPDNARVLNGLAMSYWASGDPSSALPLLERAQVLQERNTVRFVLRSSEARKLAYVRQLVWDLNRMVSFSLSYPDPQALRISLSGVLQYKGRALDAMSAIRVRLRTSSSPEDQAALRRDAEISRQMSALTARDRRAQPWLAYRRQWNRLNDIKESLESGGEVSDAALVKQRAEVVQELSALTYRGVGDLPSEAYRRRLDELTRQQEVLEGELSKRSAEFLQDVRPITLEDVRQLIPTDAVLVEWFRYEPFDPRAKGDTARWRKPHYVAYVVTREGETGAVEIGEAEPIEVLVREFRIALSDPRSTYVKELAGELSEKLMKPLQRYLDKAARLLISPDGMLNLLPFAALVDDKNEYLAKRFEISYLTSGRDLLSLPFDSGSRSREVIIVADPDFDYSARAVGQPEIKHSSDRTGGGLVFKRLPGTLAEAMALKALLKISDQNVLTGASATEARLKQLRGPRILHVATQAFFLSDREFAAVARELVGHGLDPPLSAGANPLLRSGLALAGANARRSGPNDDGILTAAEVAQLDLGGTQLVVLSASETGMGEVQNGEGVYGLRRALVLAGAQSQLVSLWKVPDAATKDLMVDYYRGLLKGEGRSGALREAQRTLIGSQDRSHPYYWAAFVPIGNWNPLGEPR